MSSRPLSELLGALGVPANVRLFSASAARGHEIVHITSDSRDVTPGSLFVAIKGSQSDGHDLIDEARAKGAAFVIGQTERSESDYLRVDDSREALGLLAARFHGDPSHSLLMVGVTGTSGKTTTTYLIEGVLREAGHRVGVIGTVETRFEGRVMESTHTTPGAVELNRVLAEMKASGCTAVVMEVSSHALYQSRTAGIAFDVAVFTNLSPEHLDYHPTLEDYFSAKSLLFKEYVDRANLVGKKCKLIINSGDQWGLKLIGEVSGHRTRAQEVMPFAVFDSGLKVSVKGIQGSIFGVEIESELVGNFNAENIAAAVRVGQALRVQPEVIARGIKFQNRVPGRLERVENSRAFDVFVDYAHKPDALDKVLRALRSMKPEGGRLITVFGCGGDRDRSKRPVMGRTAVELSDHVIITSDNPRSEDPESILNEIEAGASEARQGAELERQPDRKLAIQHALTLARRGDVVLIAGKGHETYQIVGDNKLPFDDRKVAAEFLSS
jgi:UDP-N-acetylmuramoyl-L-alanyl-D-glutamate--2,6-diaminopimelate ligase